MNNVVYNNLHVCIPMPIFPIIEDVGWWQGEDGSAYQQPYRNAFPRRHCLADYQALVRFADKLGVRIGLGMVLGEWDRNNSLGGIKGATWMGSLWNNQKNQGPWLDETAEYLRKQQGSLELGLHALCHEFWHEGQMERSEFHDPQGNMRSRQVIQSHIEAFGTILEQNGFTEFPRLFLPPALNHSFGNDKESIQAILHDYGIRYVITRFSRARRFAPLHHEKITWECGVGLLERGLSPVAWNVSASSPTWDFSGPILPLHWGNLLHPELERNNEIVDAWAELLLAETAGPERILAADFDACWRQASIYYFGKLSLDGKSIVVDLRALPVDMPNSGGSFYLKLRGYHSTPLRCQGAQIVSSHLDDKNIHILQLLPEKGKMKIQIHLC
jgi:hypothetical protein